MILNFFREQQQNIKNDTLSGLTVALALIPEAVAFAFIAGVSPVIGLYSAFFLCLIAALVGGRLGGHDGHGVHRHIRMGTHWPRSTRRWASGCT